MKIKLIAIAKDEAAYLPEWIFHHLYFGFDEIEIYVNYTTDNSYEVLDKIQKNYPVKYKKNAEYLVDPDYNQYDSMIAEPFLKKHPLQGRAYAEAFARAKTTDITHIMFLDIDEYWTPTCFIKNIKEVLVDMGDPAVASFSWKNKVGETAEFERPFHVDNLYINSPVQKLAVKTELDIKIISAHRCRILIKSSPRGEILKDEIKSFISHRFQRSEMEYTSLLGRGDCKFLGEFGLKFNRSGFVSTDNSINFTVEQALLEKYDNAYVDFLTKNDLINEIELGRKFVTHRSNIVLDYIRKIVEANKKVNKVIKGLPIEKEIYPNRKN